MVLAQKLVETGACARLLKRSHWYERYPPRSPLEAAMERDNDGAFRLVVSIGADVSLSGRYRLGGSYGYGDGHYYDGPALVAAVSRGKMEQVQELLNAGADMGASASIRDWSSGKTGHVNSLQVAVANADVEMTNFLLN